METEGKLSPMEQDKTKEYLGDGVYATFDGYHIWLETERYLLKNIIALEPAVLNALMAYADKHLTKKKENA